MPRRKYRLRPFAPRSVEIDWYGDWENLRVFFKGRALGAIQDKSTLMNGSTFYLGRDSYLNVKLQKGIFRERLALFWNGTPLPGTFSDPRWQLHLTSLLLFFSGLLMLFSSGFVYFWGSSIGSTAVLPQSLAVFSLLPLSGAYFLHSFRRKATSLMLAALLCESAVYLTSIFISDIAWTVSSIAIRLLLCFLLARGLCLIEDIYDLRRKAPPAPYDAHI